MKLARWAITGLMLCLPGMAFAAAGDVPVTLQNVLACEDVLNDRCKVEMSYTRTKVTADASVKAAPGYVESFSCAPNDSAPTAGTIVLYDNTEESGTELFRFEVTTTYFLPWSVDIHAPAAIGIYVGYTTTADVNCWANWR